MRTSNGSQKGRAGSHRPPALPSGSDCPRPDQPNVHPLAVICREMGPWRHGRSAKSHPPSHAGRNSGSILSALSRPARRSRAPRPRAQRGRGTAQSLRCAGARPASLPAEAGNPAILASAPACIALTSHSLPSTFAATTNPLSHSTPMPFPLCLPEDCPGPGRRTSNRVQQVGADTRDGRVAPPKTMRGRRGLAHGVGSTSWSRFHQAGTAEGKPSRRNPFPGPSSTDTPREPSGSRLDDHGADSDPRLHPEPAPCRKRLQSLSTAVRGMTRSEGRNGSRMRGIGFTPARSVSPERVASPETPYGSSRLLQGGFPSPAPSRHGIGSLWL